MPADWTRCIDALPPEGVVVDTKIDNADGVRNEQPLKRNGRMWFTKDMYVYYEPTHWRSREARDA